HGNLGDHAIVCAEYWMLSMAFPGRPIVEIANDEYKSHATLIERMTNDKDLVVIDGGGNLGTLWPREDDKITDIIRRFSNNRIIIFPQTCYYGGETPWEDRVSRNYEAYRGARDLTIMLRDFASFEFCQEHFPGVRFVLVPDIVLSLDPEVEEAERSGALLCFRGDCERVLREEDEEEIRRYLAERGMNCRDTSTVIKEAVGKHTREGEVTKKLLEFSSAELVVTDRLHAMIFAAITGTPCVALDNKSKKVSGVYRWIESLAHIRVVSAPGEIEKAVESVTAIQRPPKYKYPRKALIQLLQGGHFE
ncbi:MAG: polysaccharide pyruvyl transferase family protein, partial [Clostridia bacterium]|nr:polysaccharide pyruvyl transferase family protein [Clostridia bacterium]